MTTNKHAEIKQVLLSLRSAATYGRQFVVLPKKLSPLCILPILQQGGFIEGFEDRGNIVVIKLKQTYWKSFQHPFNSIGGISTLNSSKTSTGKWKQISKAQRRSGYVVTFVISTDRGILTGASCAAKSLGGLPILKIW